MQYFKTHYEPLGKKIKLKVHVLISIHTIPKSHPQFMIKAEEDLDHVSDKKAIMCPRKGYPA